MIEGFGNGTRVREERHHGRGETTHRGNRSVCWNRDGGGVVDDSKVGAGTKKDDSESGKDYPALSQSKHLGFRRCLLAFD